MSYAFYNREFNSKAAYRMSGSHIILIVPAPVSANLISNSQVSKNNFGGGVMKETFLSRNHQAGHAKSMLIFVNPV